MVGTHSSRKLTHCKKKNGRFNSFLCDTIMYTHTHKHTHTHKNTHTDTHTEKEIERERREGE